MDVISLSLSLPRQRLMGHPSYLPGPLFFAAVMRSPREPDMSSLEAYKLIKTAYLKYNHDENPNPPLCFALEQVARLDKRTTCKRRTLNFFNCTISLSPLSPHSPQLKEKNVCEKNVKVQDSMRDRTPSSAPESFASSFSHSTRGHSRHSSFMTCVFQATPTHNTASSHSRTELLIVTEGFKKGERLAP